MSATEVEKRVMPEAEASRPQIISFAILAIWLAEVDVSPLPS